MSTSVTSPVTAVTPGFSGVSKFASSLQQVLTRAVGIASLPEQSLEAGLTTLTATQTALQGLQASFSGLQQSLGSIQSAVSSGLLSSSISNGSILSATVGTGATAGTYSVEVTDLGAYSTALSSAGTTTITDPTTQGLSTAPALTLAVGAATTTITPASSSLQDLASAINSQSGGQVQATIVNVGSSVSPDYRLSLQAAKLGTDGIDLTDSLGVDLISTATAGALAGYTVDGAAAVTSTSRTVTLSPGLTINLLAQSLSGVATTVTVQNDPFALASAFSSFATAYNSAAASLSAQRGQNAGALSGDSVLQSLTNALGQLGTYSNGSPSSALANFGITLDQTGVLSVNTTAFTAAANANFSTLVSAVGNTDGGGFLQAASNILSGIEDPLTGTLPTEESSITQQIAAQQTQIVSQQATVAQLQTNLTSQIALADTAIAQLENQVSFVTGLFAQYTGAYNTQSNGLSTL